MAFFESYKNGFLIRVKLAPNASYCGIKGVFCNADGNEYLKICVNAVPEKGKANKELIDYLAKKLGIAKNQFDIISGATDHLKKIYMQTDASAEMGDKLQELLKDNML